MQPPLLTLGPIGILLISAFLPAVSARAADGCVRVWTPAELARSARRLDRQIVCVRALLRPLPPHDRASISLFVYESVPLDAKKSQFRETRGRETRGKHGDRRDVSSPRQGPACHVDVEHGFTEGLPQPSKARADASPCGRLHGPATPRWWQHLGEDPSGYLRTGRRPFIWGLPPENRGNPASSALRPPRGPATGGDRTCRYRISR
jgi:hypothetical protein